MVVNIVVSHVIKADIHIAAAYAQERQKVKVTHKCTEIPKCFYLKERKKLQLTNLFLTHVLGLGSLFDLLSD